MHFLPQDVANQFGALFEVILLLLRKAASALESEEL